MTMSPMHLEQCTESKREFRPGWWPPVRPFFVNSIAVAMIASLYKDSFIYLMWQLMFQQNVLRQTPSKLWNYLQRSRGERRFGIFGDEAILPSLRHSAE
jgi:hypothetical protein